MRSLWHLKSRGDTIIEVSLAIAIIGVALGLAYSVSNHNLINGISAVQRSSAVSIASSQIERIKNAYLSNNPILETYKVNTPFCILDNGTKEDVNKTGSLCHNFNGSNYIVNVTYSPTSYVFTASITWASTRGSNSQDVTQLFYKLPTNYGAAH
jgi:prepilin-type N-terminal cleavage/methylation domain-containing protein